MPFLVIIFDSIIFCVTDKSPVYVFYMFYRLYVKICFWNTTYLCQVRQAAREGVVAEGRRATPSNAC